MFSMVVINTKVVANFIIKLIKFHDHRPDNLGAIDFASSLLDFACSLYRSEWLCCLTYLRFESYLRDNIISVVIFMSFPNC